MPVEELGRVPVNEVQPEMEVIIGTTLSSEMRGQMIEFLKANLDVFAWSHGEMDGIDPEVACHRLNIDPSK